MNFQNIINLHLIHKNEMAHHINEKSFIPVQITQKNNQS